MAATAMSTVVSMSIGGAYMTMLRAKYGVAAAAVSGTSRSVHLYRAVADQPVPASTQKLKRTSRCPTCTKGQSFFGNAGVSTFSGRGFQVARYRCRHAGSAFIA